MRCYDEVLSRIPAHLITPAAVMDSALKQVKVCMTYMCILIYRCLVPSKWKLSTQVLCYIENFSQAFSKVLWYEILNSLTQILACVDFTHFPVTTREKPIYQYFNLRYAHPDPKRIMIEKHTVCWYSLILSIKKSWEWSNPQKNQWSVIHTQGRTYCGILGYKWPISYFNIVAFYLNPSSATWVEPINHWSAIKRECGEWNVLC